MPKSYGRNERIAAAILREVSHVLARDIKDPRVSLATVTEVKVTPDLRTATIYVSFLNDSDKQVKDAIKALQNAKGYVRTLLATRLKLRYMPAINFCFDSLIRDSMRLDALIAQGLGADNATESDDNAVDATDADAAEGDAADAASDATTDAAEDEASEGAEADSTTTAASTATAADHQ